MFQVTPIKTEIIKKIISPGVSGFIWIKPIQIAKDFPLKNDLCCQRSTCMPNVYSEWAEKIANFEVYSDDIWIVTYPKCGTTWTQEMIWLIVNEFDFETAMNIDLTERSPFLEFNGVTPNLIQDFLKQAGDLQRPRVIKTHLPSILLPHQIWTKKPKIIYVARNPKDVVVSFYHHFQHLVGYKGSLKDFSEAFLSHQLTYCPFSDHVIDFWKMRNESNILFFTFEAMKKDLKAIIRKTCKFLDKSYTDEQFEKLATHLSFDQMKINPRCNNQKLVELSKNSMGENYNENDFKFMRKGQVGSYKCELSEDDIKLFDEWTKTFMNHDNFNFNEN